MRVLQEGGPQYKKNEMFKKCEDKMDKELDVLKLMKLGRHVKLLAQVMLNQIQKMLMKFQRKFIVEESAEWTVVTL